MNKLKYIIKIIAIITLSACSEEEWQKNNNQGEIIVEAGFANTRTTFVEDDGTTHVFWEVGDKIGLITEMQNCLQYAAANEGKSTKFNAANEKLKAQEGDKIFAYFPYSDNQYLSDAQIRISPIAYQTYSPNTSECDFIYAMASVANNIVPLSFKHLYAFLKIRIPLNLIADRGTEGGIFINSSETISSHSYSTFDIEKEKLSIADESNFISYSIPTDKISDGQREVTCYIAILPQPANAELKIYKLIGNSQQSQVDECLLTKKVPEKGFQAGNIYTLYLNENETEAIRQKERNALIDFYNATGGDNWINNENWCSDKPVKEWYGIIANEGFVQSISLDNNNLKGDVYIKDLDELGSVSLNNNNLTTLDVDSCQNLSVLSCNNNKLTTLNIASNKNLRYLSCTNNHIKDLAVSNKPELSDLICANNEITILDLYASTKLSTLICYNNHLNVLNIGNVPELETLWCMSNQIKELDVSKATHLTQLDCDSNQISNLNVSNCIALESLSCFQNSLTTLDVSKNVNITSLYCSDNKLVELNIGNKPSLEDLACFNGQLTSIDVSGCPNLKSLHCGNNLIKSLDIDKNPKLEKLSCDNNQLSTLNLSNNANLTMLSAGNNQLTSINLEKQIKLESLSIEVNRLTSLNLANNPRLTELFCHFNNLSSLDISKNSKLQMLWCHANQLTSLDVTHCPDLISLWCGNYLGETGIIGNNHLTSIDLRQNTNLEDFSCYYSSLSVLDVSQNIELKTLEISNNPITEIDLSHNPLLEELWSYSCLFTTLDVSNSPNLNILYTAGCPNLSTIYILSSQEFTYQIDPYTQFVCKNKKNRNSARLHKGKVYSRLCKEQNYFRHIKISSKMDFMTKNISTSNK